MKLVSSEFLEHMHVRMNKLFVDFIGKGLRRFLSYGVLVELSNKLNFPLVPPLTAEVKVTNRCNMKCKYCDVWKHQNEMQDLSIEQLKAIFVSLRKLGVRIVTITGGEPLLRADLEEIIGIARRHHLRAHVITKGALLTFDRAVKIIESGANCIILSLDTLNPKIYKNLTGRSFKSAEKALESLLYGKEKYQNVDVALNYVINRYNIREIVHFVKKITEYSKGKIFINLQPYVRVPYRTKDDLVPSKEMYSVLAKEIEKVIEMKKQGFPITDSAAFLMRIPNFLIFNELPRSLKCKTGYVGVYICDGLQIRPCYQLPPVGNLYEKSLEDIWFSGKFREQRVKMKERKCPGCLLLCHGEESWYDWYASIDKSFEHDKNRAN